MQKENEGKFVVVWEGFHCVTRLRCPRLTKHNDFDAEKPKNSKLLIQFPRFPPASAWEKKGGDNANSSHY